MANRVDWYFKQKVTEAELDTAFDYLEQADRALAMDMSLWGIFSGLVVSAQAIPDLTVQVALGAAYSKAGERMRVASAQTVDLSKDYNNVTTSVSTPGNTKWLSVFLMPGRALTDPRTDGNGLTVFFQRAETATFKVVQGSEAPSPAKPSLDASGILLVDVLRTQGVVTISGGNLSEARRENAFVASGVPQTVSETSAKAAIQAIVSFYNNHVDGSADLHPAAAIEYAGSGAFGGTPAIAAGTVEAALDAIVAQVSRTSAPLSGVRAVGAEAQTSGAMSVLEGTLYSQLGSILSYLNTLNTQSLNLTTTQIATGDKTFNGPFKLNGLGADDAPALETTTLPTSHKLLWRIATAGTAKMRLYSTPTGLLLSYALYYISGTTWGGEGSLNGWMLEFNGTTIKWSRHNNAGAGVNKSTPVSTFTWELPVAGTTGAPNNQFLRAAGYLEGPGVVTAYGAVQAYGGAAGTTDYSFSANYPKKFTTAPSSVTLTTLGTLNIAGGYPVVGTNTLEGFRTDFRLTSTGAYALAVRGTTV